MFSKLVLWFEHIGRMRAASELARQGYHQQAKRLMCGDQERAQFIKVFAVLIAGTIIISDDAGRGIFDKKGKRKEEISYVALHR